MSFKFALNVDGTTHRLDRAREFGNHAVAGATEHPTMMVCNQTVYDLSASVERTNRRFLIGLHEVAVADHVSCKDCGEAALHIQYPSVGD